MADLSTPEYGKLVDGLRDQINVEGSRIVNAESVAERNSARYRQDLLHEAADALEALESKWIEADETAKLNKEFLDVADKRLDAASRERDELKAEVERLREALKQAQATLEIMVNPAAIKNTSVLTAWALAVEAESKARAALAEKGVANG